MTPNAARDIVYEEFNSNWSVSPEVTHTFDNEDFQTDGLIEWVHFSVQHLPTGGQHTLGPVGQRVFRRRAVIRIQFYVAVNLGLQRLDELSMAARDIFEGKTVQLVMFNDSTFIEQEPDETWYKGLLNIFFTYDETR